MGQKSRFCVVGTPPRGRCPQKIPLVFIIKNRKMENLHKPGLHPGIFLGGGGWGNTFDYLANMEKYSNRKNPKISIA